jgi:hypothetical protein
MSHFRDMYHLCHCCAFATFAAFRRLRERAAVRLVALQSETKMWHVSGYHATIATGSVL